MIKEQAFLPTFLKLINTNNENNMDQINGHTRTPYSGYNLKVLTQSQIDNNFVSNKWYGFGQARKNNLYIIKGQHGTRIRVPRGTYMSWNHVYNRDQLEIINEYRLQGME